jgi:hypothetical protein
MAHRLAETMSVWASVDNPMRYRASPPKEATMTAAAAKLWIPNTVNVEAEEAVAFVQVAWPGSDNANKRNNGDNRTRRSIETSFDLKSDVPFFVPWIPHALAVESVLI